MGVIHSKAAHRPLATGDRSCSVSILRKIRMTVENHGNQGEQWNRNYDLPTVTVWSCVFKLSDNH